MTLRTRHCSLPFAALVAALAMVAGCAGPLPPASPPPASPPAAPSAPATSAPASTPTPAVPATAAPVPTTSATQELIDFLLDVVAQDPTDGLAQRDLGLALLQRVRETADPSLYPRAQAALEAARDLLPDDPLVLAGIGGLLLGRHEFAAALKTGQDTLKRFPEYPSARGVVVDALVELGRYEEAFKAAEAYAADSPDLASLARLSYAHELRGDLDAALAAMDQAAASPGLAPENTAYVLALVGQLRRLTGDPEGAAAAYDQALSLVPDHAPSLAGLGRLAVGRGDLDEARQRFERAGAIVPLPEYVIALGETLEAMGDDAGAQDQYELAAVLITLFKANGVVVDVDLALFEADHGDAARALELATAGYAAAPTIRAADATAWALHRLGRDQDASRWSAEALRLGSRDPLLRYHAGAIAAALGEVEDARRDLEAALATDPGFSPTGAAEALAILQRLSQAP
ncbi:MAG: tetratricopeptide repeat protein [Candidatus Limnocylindrales bacterium]